MRRWRVTHIHRDGREHTAVVEAHMAAWAAVEAERRGLVDVFGTTCSLRVEEIKEDGDERE